MATKNKKVIKRTPVNPFKSDSFLPTKVIENSDHISGEWLRRGSDKYFKKEEKSKRLFDEPELYTA